MNLNFILQLGVLKTLIFMIGINVSQDSTYMN